MASLSKITVGQTLYSVRSQAMGNTTMRCKACFEVNVKEVHPDHIIASWNGNPPRKYRERDIKQLKVKKPVPKKEIYGFPSY